MLDLSCPYCIVYICGEWVIYAEPVTYMHTSPGCRVHVVLGEGVGGGRCGRVKVTQLRVVTSGWNVGWSARGYRNQR